MNDTAGSQSELEPVSIILEFARAEKGGDPFAFRLGRLQYLVRSEDGSFETAELDWNQSLLDDLNAVRKQRPDPAIVQRMGETLRQFLQPTGWVEHETQILQAAQNRRRVILTLRSAAAELYSLPWELITIKGTGQHIAEFHDVLVRYEWPGTHTTPEPPSQADSVGRILMCWSAEAGAVPAADHIAAIRKAAEQLPQVFSASRDVMAHASVDKIDEALQSARRSGPPIVVMHILCHGSSVNQTFGLALSGDGEEETVVDAGRLRRLLGPYADMVRLVVLSACDSGNDGTLGNQLGSVAQALHRAGLSYVVASRYPLSVHGSIRLTEALYRELLADTGSVEQAVLSARRELARDPDQLDWASLQLYSHSNAPAFQRPSYLRGLKETTKAPTPAIGPLEESTNRETTLAKAAAPDSLLRNKRNKMIAIAAVIAVVLIVVSAVSVLWAASQVVDEGPIVLQNGKCLGVAQDDFATRRDGGDVMQWVCSGEPSQNWHWESRRIVSSNGLCLEVSPPDYQSGKNGGRIQVGVCNVQMDNQQWQYNRKELRTYNSKCVSIEPSDFDAGKQGGEVVQWECTGKPNQWFSDGHGVR